MKLSAQGALNASTAHASKLSVILIMTAFQITQTIALTSTTLLRRIQTQMGLGTNAINAPRILKTMQTRMEYVGMRTIAPKQKTATRRIQTQMGLGTHATPAHMTPKMILMMTGYVGMKTIAPKPPTQSNMTMTWTGLGMHATPPL